MSEISNSKNVVSNARLDAKGNIVVGDTIINLKEAAQYKALEADIEKLNKRFERTRKRMSQLQTQSDEDDNQLILLDL